MVAPLDAVDGVPVFHKPGVVGYVSATLTFAVGLVDETLPTLGVGHMIEHLAMSTTRHLPVESNATVRMSTTHFYAEGHPDQVAAFLEQVCRALTDLPLDRLEVEKGVIEVEASAGCHPVASLLFKSRYGGQGPGLTPYAGPGEKGLTSTAVQGFVERWLVRENALLEVTGVLPPTLRLPLPQGPVGPRVRPEGHVHDSPRTIGDSPEDLGVMLRMPADSGAMLDDLVAETLRLRIFETCRHELGLSYRIDVERVFSRSGAEDVVISADAREGKTVEVAKAIVAAVFELADPGPTAAELDVAKAMVAERWSGPFARANEQFRDALRARLGVPPAGAVDVEAMRRVEPATVSQAIQSVLSTAVFYAPEETLPELQNPGLTRAPICAVVPELPAGSTYRPPRLARAFNRDARDWTLVVTEDGLALENQEGRHVVHWCDVIGVEKVDEDLLVVHGLGGCSIPVGPAMFSGSSRVYDDVLARVDRSLVFDSLDDE